MSKLWCNLCSKCYAMDCFDTYFTHFTYVPQPGVGGWGGVQWHALYLHTYSMLRNCTCAHVRCYAIALAHMFDATQLHLRHMFDATQLHLGTCYQCNCSHQKKIFASDMKRKPRGLSKKKGTQTIDRAWLSLKRFLPKEANKKKGKGMFADVRELLEERVKQWTWRAELLRVNPHLSKQQFLKHLAKVC